MPKLCTKVSNQKHTTPQEATANDKLTIPLPGQLTIQFSVPIEMLKEALVSGMDFSAISSVENFYLDPKFSGSVVGIDRAEDIIPYYRDGTKFIPLADFGGGMEVLPLARGIFSSNLTVCSELSIGKYEYKGRNRVKVFVTFRDRFSADTGDTLAGLDYHQRRIYRFLFSRTYDRGELHKCEPQDHVGGQYLLFKATKGKPNTVISNPHVTCRFNPPKFVAREVPRRV